jgi:hypothetical protein
MNTPQNTHTPRRLDLDWIRIVAFGLLILYHVGMYYVSWGWHIKSPFASDAIEPLMIALNPWRLPLLFLVSGCATAFLLRSSAGRSLARVAAQRSRFLLVPLVFGMVVIVPPQSYYEVMDKMGFAGGYLAFWARYLAADHGFCPGGRCIGMPTWNHLWFVVYLWVYTMLLLAARALLPLTRFGDVARHALSGWGLVLWPWLWLAIARMVLFPRFGSTHALVGDFYNHAQYVAAFAIGYWLAHASPTWDWLAARRWPLLSLAAGAYTVLITYYLHFGELNPPPEALRAAMRTVFALQQWSAILAVLGWGHHTLARQRDTRLRAYLTDAVFCWYIVHQTAIIVAAHALRGLALQPAVEGPLLIGVTVAVCLVSYELARRVPLLRPLFGIRAPARRLTDIEYSDIVLSPQRRSPS